MTSYPAASPRVLADRVLAVLARDAGRTDAELAAELGVSTERLSPVIGMLYRRGLADRCGPYIVAVPRASAGPADQLEAAMPAHTSPARSGDRARLEAALGCAARGWPVIPLRPGGKEPAFPGHTAGRCPGTDPRCAGGHTGWEARATTDTTRIRRAWAAAAYNIGVATGPAGLVVIDLDTPKPGQAPPPEWAEPGITSGADVLAALCERHGQPWPGETFTVGTRRGGLHLYFTAPPGARLANTSGGSQRGLGWLIDTRAHGGYVVGPGSYVDQPDGAGPYTVIYGPPPAPLPGWLAGLLTSASPAPAPVGCSLPLATVTALPSYADAAVGGEAERVLRSPERGHNWALNKAAYNLGRRIAAGTVDRHLAEQALQAAGETAHTCETPARIAAVIAAGIDAGIRKATGAAA